MGNQGLTERAKKYWTSVEEAEAELAASYPMGGGGLVEAPYRHYFEERHFKKIVALNRSMDFLELGCGNGRWAVAIAPLVKHYTGVDLSRQSLEISRRKLEEAGIDNVDLKECSIVDFRGDRAYDVVYFGSVIQYLQDDEVSQVLTNLLPSLKPGACIVDRSSISYHQRQTVEDNGYVCIYRTPAEIEAIFEKHGFRKTYQKRSYRFMRPGPIHRLNRLLPQRWRKLPEMVRMTRPFSFYVLLFMTWLMDTLRPQPWRGGERSHDFFVFVREDRRDA